MKQAETITPEQFKEYLSKIPLTESSTYPRAVRVDYSLEEELAR